MTIDAHPIHAALALCLAGCGWLELDPASAITTTEPIATRVQVVELGPLDPERVYIPSDAPVAEFLPGDRVRFEVVVVDAEGLPLAEEALDSVWIHCGVGPCQDELSYADPVYDQPCDELEQWTTDSRCRLGEGRGSFELEVPPLGEEVLLYGQMAVYAVVAWHGQRAEGCWTARRERADIAPDCGFVRFDGQLGPQWWMLRYAESEGLVPPISTERFPAPVFGQQANRAPVLEQFEIEIDDEPPISVLPRADGFAGPVAVEPGALVQLRTVIDPTEQLWQSAFYPITESAFIALPEDVWLRLSTAGPIRVIGEPDSPGTATLIPALETIGLHVDEHAEPGIARVVIAMFDFRGGEEVAWLELEVK